MNDRKQNNNSDSRIQPKFVKPSVIGSRFDVTHISLQQWAKQGLIDHVVTPSGRYLYNIKQIEDNISYSKQAQSREKNKISLIYCRVSSKKQEQDLQRQVQLLSKEYPNHKVFTDIASGLNWKRQGFNSVLELVMQGNVREIVITYKDRLTRFGYELFEKIASFNNTKIKIHNKSQDIDSCEELTQDLLSIVNVFVARNNGRRSKGHRKRSTKNAEGN